MTPISVATTVWLVEAKQIDEDYPLSDEECTIFRMVLPTREKATEVCRAGEVAVPNLRWSMIRVLFDDVEYAKYDIEYLARELSDIPSVS